MPVLPKSSLKNLTHHRYSIKQMIQMRYDSVKKKLIKNNYIPLIKKAAQAFDLDPILVLGAIVGEHVFNLDIKDKAQDYLLKQSGWISEWFRVNDEFEIDFSTLIRMPNFDKCHSGHIENDYDKWNCYGSVWNREFRNKECSNCRETSRFPNKSLKFTYFSPFGSTYGVGQLGPIRALMVSDIVSERVPSLDPLSTDNIKEVYSAILDPQKSFYYVAGNLWIAIQEYEEHSCFDISTNPGVVATLYNLGNETNKAKKKRNENIRSLNKELGHVYPSENFFGWFVNDEANDLRELLENN